MAYVERSIYIAAPADHIWNFAMQAERLPEWFTGVSEVQVDDNYPEIGSGMDLVYKAAGATFTLSSTVEDMSEAEHIIFGLDGMVSGTNSWYYEPQEDGGTVVTYINDYEMAGGALGQALDRLVVQRQIEKQVDSMLENFKAFAEA